MPFIERTHQKNIFDKGYKQFMLISDDFLCLDLLAADFKPRQISDRVT